jgi:hypothetical protein
MEPVLRKIKYSVRGSKVHLQATGPKVRSCSSEIRVWDSRLVLWEGLQEHMPWWATSMSHHCRWHAILRTNKLFPAHSKQSVQQTSLACWSVTSSHYINQWFMYNICCCHSSLGKGFHFFLRKNPSFLNCCTSRVGFYNRVTYTVCQIDWPFLQIDWSFHQTVSPLPRTDSPFSQTVWSFHQTDSPLPHTYSPFN